MCKSGNIIRACLFAIWLVAFGIYLRFEAYPVWFTRTVAGYRGILPDALLARESWARILINDQPAGYLHTIFTMDDDGPEPILEISSSLQIRARIFQTVQRIQVASEIKLDQDYDPIRFTLSAAAGNINLRVVGERVAKQLYEITIVSEDNETRQTVKLPPDTVIYSPLYELAIQQLRPGRSLAIRTLDPLTLQSATIMVTAAPWETIRMHGQDMRAMPVTTQLQGLELRSWVDENGIMLRQETPFGWIMEAANAEQALATISEDLNPPDLLRSPAGLSLVQSLIGAGTP